MLEAQHVACDVGLYGEPSVAGFRSRRDIRELQKFVDAPAFWGASYMTRDELSARYDFATYERLRGEYRAGAAEEESSGGGGGNGGGGGSGGGGGGAAASASVPAPAPALLDIRDKTTFFDPSKPDLGPIPFWRLYRAGLLPYAIGAAAVSAAAVVAAAAYFVLRHRGASA